MITDNDLQEFSTAEYTFKCVPNQTSNYDIFKLVNRKLTDNNAFAIWEYYRTLFINAKLTGRKMSSFHQSLQRFIEGKPYKDEVSLEGRTPFNDRTTDINRYIELARWLKLQYNVDNAIEQLSQGWDRLQLEKQSQRIQGTVQFNNYVSYFSENINEKLKNLEDYDTRKLKVRSAYAYTHKQIRWYICASEFGAVKIWVHTKHNTFIEMFENRINNGVEINVVTSKIVFNIDDTTPYIKIENFFIND
jgi:hypothetical protein